MNCTEHSQKEEEHREKWKKQSFIIFAHMNYNMTKSNLTQPNLTQNMS